MKFHEAEFSQGTGKVKSVEEATTRQYGIFALTEIQRKGIATRQLDTTQRLGTTVI